MIYIFGDSHGKFSFSGISVPVINLSEPSITMFRIGRDGILIGFRPEQLGADSIFVCSYGEVDCRCHVARQIVLGRAEEDICRELVEAYIRTIKINLTSYLRPAEAKAIIVCAVPPPTRQAEYEAINGPITHDFPFIGSDADRVRWTGRVNALLEEACSRDGLIFFDGYGAYRREDGTLRYEWSDRSVHIQNVVPFQAAFLECLNRVNAENKEAATAS